MITNSYEGHAITQGRAARMAHEADHPKSRAVRERLDCAPAALNDAKTRAKAERVDRLWDDCIELGKHPESDVINAYKLSDPICDERLHLAQTVIYKLIDLLLAGEPDRPEALISAVRACFRGEHVGESTAEIAKAHGAPVRPLRRLLVGLRAEGIL